MILYSTNQMHTFANVTLLIANALTLKPQYRIHLLGDALQVVAVTFTQLNR